MASKKLLLLTGVIATVGLTSIAAVNVASAHSNGNQSDTIVEKLSQKFNINKDEVKKVFEEQRQARSAEMQSKFVDNLSQAVKDGKITEDQKSKLIAKESEIRTVMQSLKGKTSEERKAAMETKKAETEKWLKENNIPDGLLPGPGAHGKPNAERNMSNKN